MSTSLLYHGFGLVGYTYVRTAYEEGKVIFTIKHKRDKLHCPECGSRDLILRGCSAEAVPHGAHRIEGDLSRISMSSGSHAGVAMRSARSISALHKFAMEGKKLIDRHKKTKPDYQKCIQTNKDFERARSEGRCFNGPPPTIMTFQMIRRR